MWVRVPPFAPLRKVSRADHQRMANVETLEGLERRVSMTLPAAEIEKQVDTRLKQLARNIKMPGFRPGKVPMKIVAQTYGPPVRSEVLGDAVQKTFTDVVKEANLKLAGYPRIEKKDGADPAALEFSATFEIYPAVKVGYLGKQVAGKRGSFKLALKKVEEPQLPELDAEFAKTLGVADGDLDKMRSEIRANVERETAKRVEARLKAQVLQALLDATPLELPKSLVQMEAQQMVERAANDLRARGIKPEQMPLDPAAFEQTAKRRVALGLIIGELARTESLQPKPADVRALVEQEAATYESPAEVVKWFYMQPQRLSEVEGVALEANVVKWALSKAKVVDKPVELDELMGSNA